MKIGDRKKVEKKGKAVTIGIDTDDVFFSLFSGFYVGGNLL